MKPEKQKKKAGWVTVTVNILFILAICAVGWRIVDYLIQEKESADLSERLWQQAAVSKPAVEEPTGEQAPQAAFSDRTAASPPGNSCRRPLHPNRPPLPGIRTIRTPRNRSISTVSARSARMPEPGFTRRKRESTIR